MATLYGFEGISSSRIRIRPSIRITPPDSTRPSLDESESHTGSADVSVNSRLQAQVTESLDFRADLEAALAEVSPPPTPPRSPSKGLGKLITQIKPILNGSGIDLILIKNVSVQLFDELRAKANAGDCDELFGLEKQRIDYDGNNLIINHPSIGHEIIQGILDLVDGGYPRRNPHISMENKIMSGGSADVRLRGGGLKQPDFSIYEIREGSTKHDDEEPTIAFEVGLSQRQRKLGEAAARLLLLCRYGTILLVVTVKIVVSGDPEKLDSVTWTHWEVTSWEKVKKPEEKPANELYVIRSVPDKVDERGMPLAYEITRKSGERQVVVRAAVTAKYQVFPDDKKEKIAILERHHYRNCPAEKWITPAYHITYQNIMEVVGSLDGIGMKQKLSDKCTPADQDETYKDLTEPRETAMMMAKRKFNEDFELKSEGDVAAKKQRIGE